MEFFSNLLWRAMSEVSEYGYCAGWMRDLEYHLWEICQAGSGEYGFCVLSREEVRRLLGLAYLAGGWWTYDKFIPYDEWLLLYNRWAAENV